MKRISLLICAFILFVLAACSAPKVSPYDSQDTKISITVEEGIVDRRAETLTLIVQNLSDIEYVSGVDFQLETERNGVWYQYPPKEDIAWIDIAYIIAPGGIHKDNISLFSLYGELKPGTYRVVKTFYHENGSSVAFGVFSVS